MATPKLSASRMKYVCFYTTEIGNDVSISGTIRSRREYPRVSDDRKIISIEDEVRVFYTISIGDDVSISTQSDQRESLTITLKLHEQRHSDLTSVRN